MAHLENVEITPNPVNVGSQYKLCITISTWDFLLKNHSWAELSGEKWNNVNSKWDTGGKNG